MSYQPDQDEDELDDRELPDPSDMDQDGDDEGDETEPCPHCKRPVYAQAPYCPHCGIEISWERLESRRPLWIAMAVAVCLFVVICWIVMNNS